MPPKKTQLQAAAAAQAAANNQECIRLLEASKKWRADLRALEDSAEPIVDLTTTVEGALDELVTANVAVSDKVMAMGRKVNVATKGAEVANSTSNKALAMAQSATKDMAELAAANAAKIEELILNSKRSTEKIQRLELAQSETIILCKGVEAITTNEHETQKEMRQAITHAFNSMNIRDVRIEHVRRMQRVHGDRGTAPPALRVRMGSVGDKLRVFEAMRRVTASGNHQVPYDFQNEVPKYALSTHKQLHKLSVEIRKIDKDIKTRVTMMKGELWPIITMKRKGESHYKAAPKELIDLARTNMHRNSKAVASIKRNNFGATNRNDDDDMDQDPAPGASSGPAGAAGTTIMHNHYGMYKGHKKLTCSSNPFLSLFSAK